MIIRIKSKKVLFLCSYTHTHTHFGGAIKLSCNVVYQLKNRVVDVRGLEQHQGQGQSVIY